MSEDVPVGRIAGSFGVHGELKCDPTRAGRALFTAGARMRAQLGSGASEEAELTTVREHKGRLLVRFAAASSAEEAARFIGASLFAARERITLAHDEFFDADLEGCTLYNRGSAVGIVERVEHYPASDMLVVRGKMIPLIAEFVKKIDLEHKRIAADLPEGLIDG